MQTVHTFAAIRPHLRACDMSQPRGHDLGKGLTLLHEFAREWDSAHTDLDAFGAPSECHGLLRKSERKAFTALCRQVEAITGLSFVRFLDEVERRTSARWAYLNCWCLVPSPED